MQLFEVQAPLLGEIAPLLGGLVESAQGMFVSHEGARSRWGRLPLLLSAAVTATAACSQTLAAHATWEGEKRALTCANQYSEITQFAPEIKQNPPGGVAGRVAWIGAGDRGGGSADRGL